MQKFDSSVTGGSRLHLSWRRHVAWRLGIMGKAGTGTHEHASAVQGKRTISSGVCMVYVGMHVLVYVLCSIQICVYLLIHKSSTLPNISPSYLAVCLSIHPSIIICINTHHLYIHPSMYLSICISTSYPSIHPSTQVSIHPSIHLFAK